MRNVLVLGAGGFIGSKLTEALLASGSRVTALTRGENNDFLKHDSLSVINGDMSDKKLLSSLIGGVDVIFHLISTTYPRISNVDPVNDIQTNLCWTVSLLELVREIVPSARIVFMSSGGTVYGNQDSTSLQEQDEGFPLCSYGIVKLAIEKYLDMYHKNYGLGYTVLRASNPYGSGGRKGMEQGLIPVIFRCIKDDVPLTVWGDGENVRDYIYVDDLVDLCVKAGSSGHNGIFNAGSGTGAAVNEVIELVSELSGRVIKTSYVPERRKFDVRNVVLDISKAKQCFDWSPDTSLADGIRIMLAEAGELQLPRSA